MCFAVNRQFVKWSLTPWKSDQGAVIEDLLYLNAEAAGAVINAEIHLITSLQLRGSYTTLKTGASIIQVTADVGGQGW